MSGRLSGKVAFITGAARGQGRSHAVRFAEEGADIIGIDVCEPNPSVGYPMATPADLHETVKLVEKTGQRMVVGQADVRDRASLETVLVQGTGEFGRLDFVIANAGVMPVYGELANEMAAWQTCLDVMLTGVMNTVELTYPRLVDQGEGGSIAITGSMAGVKPMMRTSQAHTLGLLAYSAAKAALVNLARNYASFLAYHHIRVNVVQPAGVETPMIRNQMVDEYHKIANPEDGKCLVTAIPIIKLDPVDVSNMMVWLCSDESRYFTGHAIRIDAGADLR
jgi:SDR family mycofactocin-dependent oxidoreductase